MKHPKILALILAGGKGSRMDALTKVRAKPTLPFAGVYHLIDFPLSNCVHSAISNVWVIEQFLPFSLNKHLANGRPWDLDRTYGGLEIIQPHQGTEGSGFHQGNADAIFRNQSFIRDFDPDLLVVLSADHVYKCDYRTVIDHHLEHEADVTMVVTKVPRKEASRFGNVVLGDDDKVDDFEYKPERPRSDWATTEVFVYNARTLLDTLDQLAEQKRQNNGEDATLEDFGHELIPHLVKQGRAYGFRFDGYWRDVGTIESYWEGHMDLLKSDPRLDLDEVEWPILTYGVQRMPAHIHQSAHVDNSLISPGCVVHGTVINSVLTPGVVVEEGAVIRNSVVLQDAHIGANATVDHAIIDQRAQIGQKAQIGASPNGDQLQIALVGQGAKIAASATVPADARIEPNETYDDTGKKREQGQ